MGSFNSLSITDNSSSSVTFTANFTTSATTNTFRYRLQVGLSSGSTTRYCYSNVVSTNSVSTYTLSATADLLEPSTPYDVYAVIQYYDTGASSPSWADSSLSRSTTHTTIDDTPVLISGTISSVSTSVSETSATVNWTWTPEDEPSWWYFIYYDTGTVTSNSRSTSESAHSSQTGSRSCSKTISGLSPGTQYNFRIVMCTEPGCGVGAQGSSYNISDTYDGRFTTQSSSSSSFSYAGYSYPNQTSVSGQWDVDVNLSFQHISPTDGRYQYKVKYWYFDQTAGETSSPDYFTGTLLDEISGSHSDSRTHTLTVSLGLTGGHTYAFNAELWYRVISSGGTVGDWAASSLGMIGRKTITVKAANDGGGDPSGPTTGSITGSHSSVTTSSAQISASASLNVGSYPYYYQILFRVYDNQGTLVYDDETSLQTINSGSSNPYTGSGSRTVNGLSSGASYRYQVVLYGGTNQNSLTQLDYDEGNFTTSSSGGGGDDPGPDQPILYVWSWETASGSWNAENQPGHASLASAAQTAVQNHGATTDFSHLIWNDIIDWLCDCLDAVEYSYSSSTVTTAKMNTSDKVLTAVRFNNMISLWMALRSVIGTESDPWFTEVSTGDTVRGSNFINLAYWMNAFITDYNDDNS